ncbi:TetR family transcriptional regulator [Nakamurella sp. YIM 132087]|uniref:TetR family transcriptional regulator n=1 Tax=Nakamurella alba TaxID=2665158 RepID=A0A7K1FKM5_9ACTN|nr:TetR/AcrR family transcriptional regulator [Nakamurella alba]MTD14658.1 TetR family transcriptional regulator [Nakamurella alba]
MDDGGPAANLAVDGSRRGRTLDRRRRELRHRLSDKATAMFLEQGFDAVRVADVAQACGVSTKTVWNHFPTKESLLFDRGEALAEVLNDTVGTPAVVLDAVMDCIRDEVGRLDSSGPAGLVSSESDAVRMVRAFVLLVESSPALQTAAAYQVERLTRLAADTLAAGNGSDPLSPTNQIRAGALIGLWRVHLSALLRYATSDAPLEQLRRGVLHDVGEGRRLIGPLFDPPAGKADGTQPA